MAKPNYSFEKRQKELAKKKKKEKKRLKKMEKNSSDSLPDQPLSDNDDKSVPTVDGNIE